MGKFSLFLAIGAFIVGSYYVLGLQDTVLDNQQQVSKHTYRTLAREVALTGFGIADKGLKDAPEDYGNPSRSFSGSFNDGTYTVTVTNPPLVGAGPVKSTIEVVGEVHGETYRIQATYEKKLDVGSGEGGGGGLPKFMEYGLIANGTINFNGGAEIYPPGYPHSHMLNANVHSNERLTMNGSGNVIGFGTFSAPLNDQGIINRTSRSFKPAFSPDGTESYDPVHHPASYYQAPKVDIPVFKAGDYKHLAHEVHEHGNYELRNRHIEGGTESNPKIIYVANELQIKNNVTISGHVIFAVRGNIIINGSFSNRSADGTLSNIALYTQGTLNINGSSEIQGQILSQWLNMNGSSTFYGSIATRDHINFNGSARIYYRKANAGLTKPFWPGEEAASEPVVALADFREHNVLKP